MEFSPAIVADVVRPRDGLFEPSGGGSRYSLLVNAAIGRANSVHRDLYKKLKCSINVEWSVETQKAHGEVAVAKVIICKVH